MNTHTLTQLLSLLADAKELNYSYEIILQPEPPSWAGDPQFLGHAVIFYEPPTPGGRPDIRVATIDVEPHQINHYSTVRKFFDEKLGLQRLRKTALAKLTAQEIEILGIKT
jgi:hypothetical protein